MDVKTEERGWPGHFIGAHNCKFRRNTLVTGPEQAYVVSTVGLYQPERMCDFVDIGFIRYYETMTFLARDVGGYLDADVMSQIDMPAETPWAIAHITNMSDKEANDMHEANVAALVEMIKSGWVYEADPIDMED